MKSKYKKKFKNSSFSHIIYIVYLNDFGHKNNYLFDKAWQKIDKHGE